MAQNRSIRAALRLIDCDEATAVTRVDLAIMANNKLFMGHPATEHFLDGLWQRTSSNGKFVDFVTGTSPRSKYLINVAGYLAFLAVYTKVFVDIPFYNAGATETPDVLEIVFWCWVGIMFLDELFQANTPPPCPLPRPFPWPFRWPSTAFTPPLPWPLQATDDFDSFWMYLRGSGNQLDVMIYGGFLLSGTLRLVVTHAHMHAYTHARGRRMPASCPSPDCLPARRCVTDMRVAFGLPCRHMIMMAPQPPLSGVFVADRRSAAAAVPTSYLSPLPPQPPPQPPPQLLPPQQHPASSTPLRFDFHGALTCWLQATMELQWAYIAYMALLCINLIVCSVRLLHMLSINRPIGILLIIIIRIMKKDVGAFVVFCAVVVCSFEVSGFFFSWALESRHQYGVFFHMFSQVIGAHHVRG